MQTDAWDGCYDDSWKGKIVPEAFSHPAKYSRGLIRRIYEHAIEENWLHEGDCCIDPFGGVGLGALDAMKHGLTWVGVELEERFVTLGTQNIELWLSRYAPHFPAWGTAVLLQGDSRQLVSLLAANAVQSCVSSPPYSETPITQRSNFLGEANKNGQMANVINRADGYGDSSGQLAQMRATDAGLQAAISSPPYAESEIVSAVKAQHSEGRQATYKRKDGLNGYADNTPGQLGAMKADGFDAAVSSPPYEGTSIQQTHMTSNKRGDKNNPNYRPSWEKKLAEGYADTTRPYGSSDGQLGAMKADGFEAAVSSPPFQAQSGGTNVTSKSGPLADERLLKRHAAGNITAEAYGITEGQLGREEGDDFWSAARVIIEQTYSVLAPGAHAIWVVKSFVKNKKIVDFPGQWRTLCEACGFVTVHEHHASLVKNLGTQIDLFGNEHTKLIKRYSFFRHMIVKKYPHLEIPYEVVLCMQKPDYLERSE